MRRGWPAAALALTVAKTPWGEGHLVVTVRTDQGDLVLDNLRSSIVSWRSTGYDWIMRQSERNPQILGSNSTAARQARSMPRPISTTRQRSPEPTTRPTPDRSPRTAAASLRAEPRRRWRNGGARRSQGAGGGSLDRRPDALDRRQSPSRSSSFFEGVVAALDRLIEPSLATQAKPAEQDEREAKGDPVSSTGSRFSQA